MSERRPIIDKPADTLELFFDLVFVFAITQVVKLIIHDLTPSGVFHGLLVLALLWWGWGNFTWATNSVDLSPRWVRVGVLVGMAPVFVMSQAVPFAFEGQGLWVAVGYVIVRAIALWLSWLGARDDEEQARGIRLYASAGVIGPVLIIVGTFMGDGMQWWWLAGFLAELAASGVAGQAEWHLAPGHFAERHGLIIIIALGEAIIAVGAAVVDETPSVGLANLLAAGLLGAAAMYWAYFDRLQEVWEHALAAAGPKETGTLARDVYSILHYPIIAGIVLYASGVEEAVLHPNDPLIGEVRWLIGGALASFLLAMVAATWRARRILLYERIIGSAVIGGVLWIVGDTPAQTVLFVVTLILLATMAIEWMRFTAAHRARAAA